MNESTKEFTAVTATINGPDANGQMFTKNALKQIVEEAAGKVIFMDFDPTRAVGQITGARLMDNGERVEIVGVLQERWADLHAFVVPAYQIKCVEDSKGRKGIALHDDVEVIHFGFTREPADKTVSPIKINN